MTTTEDTLTALEQAVTEAETSKGRVRMSKALHAYEYVLRLQRAVNRKGLTLTATERERFKNAIDRLLAIMEPPPSATTSS